jgi:hypothetical protein
VCLVSLRFRVSDRISGDKNVVQRICQHDVSDHSLAFDDFTRCKTSAEVEAEESTFDVVPSTVAKGVVSVVGFPADYNVYEHRSPLTCRKESISSTAAHHKAKSHHQPS